MKPEKQRAVIAEACGWNQTGIGIFGTTKDKPVGFAPSRPLNAWPCEVLPDYLNDLNAMNEAEALLRTEQFDRYRADLWKLVGNECCAFESCAPLTAIRSFISATAAQRAEAFLRAIGKWEDDE